MNKILYKERLNSQVQLMRFYAPLIANKALPGQFVMLRVYDKGERIPLTVAGTDKNEGSVTLIFQEVGKTTKMLGMLNQGDSISDLAGPLGKPSHLAGIGSAAVVGGGLGIAIAYPQAKALFDMGAHVDVIAGFRNKDLIILEKELKQSADRVFIATDDGSNGNEGFVTDVLRGLIEQGNIYDEVIAIGPMIMMKMIAELTRPYGIKTTISMNSIMVDGTGMCGGCRLTVDGKTRFACVDGPDFDAHLVDFDEAMRRGSLYREAEIAADKRHSEMCLMK